MPDEAERRSGEGPTIAVPDYGGASLVNLVAELEHRLTGASVAPRLRPDLASLIPDGDTYVLVLLDGLGDAQLTHPACPTLLADRRASLHAPFPATTTVSLASVATGLPPSAHGLIGYQLYLPDLDQVVNSIKWTTLWGAPVEYPTEGFLPAPNLWERLAAGGAEAITVQPLGFEQSPLTRLLYRGCRFEGTSTVEEWVAAVAQLSSTPGRLIFAYLPQVDFAAHVYGQAGPEYAAAVSIVDVAWARLRSRLGAATAVVTADHGHVDFATQIRLPRELESDRRFYGDGRAMFVRGDGAEDIADRVPARWIPVEDALGWWGPKPRHAEFDLRVPDGILLARDDVLLLHRHSDDRMVGNHGAMTHAEQEIPLIVAGPPQK